MSITPDFVATITTERQVSDLRAAIQAEHGFYVNKFPRYGAERYLCVDFNLVGDVASAITIREIVDEKGEAEAWAAGDYDGDRWLDIAISTNENAAVEAGVAMAVALAHTTSKWDAAADRRIPASAHTPA